MLRDLRSFGRRLELGSAADPERASFRMSFEILHLPAGRQGIPVTTQTWSSAVDKTTIQPTALLIESGVSITDNQTQN